MSPSYLLPPLLHQEGMVAWPEFGRPAERRNEVPCDHAGRRKIRLHGPSWVGEGNARPPGDLIRGPLKEGQEEDVQQQILYHLK